MLRVEGVSKTYRLGSVEVPVLHDINLEVEKGEFVALMGPSGSGKSTLMNLIGCLDRPTRGRIFIEGRDVSKLDDKALSRIRGEKIGFVFQTFNLVSRLTALKNVEMPMVYQKVPREKRLKRAQELLEMVGLGGRVHHKPGELSGGQRQRVAIARALANRPAIILADEPTGNLDTRTGEEIMGIFKQLNREEERTILVVTHSPEIAGNCTRIVEMRDGRIQSLG